MVFYFSAIFFFVFFNYRKLVIRLFSTNFFKLDPDPQKMIRIVPVAGAASPDEEAEKQLVETRKLLARCYLKLGRFWSVSMENRSSGQSTYLEATVES